MPSDEHQSEQPCGKDTLPLHLRPTMLSGTTDASDPGSTIDGEIGGHMTRNLSNESERYRNPKTIGTGGIGVITSCLDPNLGRRVAVKTLRGKYAEAEGLRVRFVREARVMSQLEHPNIVPVHELGERPDGTIYFTMKQVYGESLEWVLQRLEAGDPDYLHDYPGARLMDIFVHICQGVAFAHSRGVIHRDLKPENVMIGAFGEVQVMDWGLLKVMGGVESPDDPDAMQTAGATPSTTIEGQIAGTPLYMSPEQAAGRIDLLDERSDLYALGAILYRILTRRRYVAGADVAAVLEQVREKLPTPPHRIRVGRRRVPRELSAICMKALAKRQEDRYQRVQELIDDLERHQRGLPVSVYREPLLVRGWKMCRRHPVGSVAVAAAVALALVLAASLAFVRHQRFGELLTTAREYKSRGDQLARHVSATQARLAAVRARQRLKARSRHEDALSKRLDWLRTHCQSQYDIARLLYAQAVPLARAPVRDVLDLIHLPGLRRTGQTTSERRLAPVLRDLVDSYRQQIDLALAMPDPADARRLFGMMETWVPRTPGGYDYSFHSWRNEVARRLSGHASLRVEADAPDALVRLYRIRPDRSYPDLARPDRRGGPCLEADLLLPGSYLLAVSVPDRDPVHAPVHVGRDEAVVMGVHVPAEIPAGMVYVPAGRAILGGDDSPFYRSAEIFVPGFFIRRHEVTFAEYLEFWREEPDPARREAWLPYVRLHEDPRDRAPAWDAEGTLASPLTPDLPVAGITKRAADAYCQWLAARTGREIRLPTADEWEKAARGADGRRFPWGDDFRWDCARLQQTATGERNRLCAKPGNYPEDCSIYGAMDMGGNVREWTATACPESPQRFQLKGGSVATGRRGALCAHADTPDDTPADAGFRYVIPLARESGSQMGQFRGQGR